MRLTPLASVLFLFLLASCESPEPLPLPEAEVAPVAAPVPTEFFHQLEKHASELAARPYASGVKTAPEFYRLLTYDQHRDIRFDKAHALWAGGSSPFSVEFFHPGPYTPKTIRINEVVNGKARPFPFSDELFQYGPLVPKYKGERPDGYCGFRLHTKLNSPEYQDEFIVFQGASYFRAVAKTQVYGLSARALALNTVQPAGEEFPDFEEFWLERPAPDAKSLTIYGLLNGPSVCGAYQFNISAGRVTVNEVTSTLFFRKAPGLIGIAPFSSMFWYGANTHPKPDDYRPSVRDSDGLLLAQEGQPPVWRPLDLSKEIRHSTFWAPQLREFGLFQRDRRFSEQLDLEANYHKRPSVSVFPRGSWGNGWINLIEIPTGDETSDNVVAFWQPQAPPPLLAPQHFNYRLEWHGRDAAAGAPVARLSRAVDTRRGLAFKSTDEVFVVEFSRFPHPPGANPVAKVEVGPGLVLKHQGLRANPETGGWRLTLSVALAEGKRPRDLDLRAHLLLNDKQVSETWTYLWTP